jgi:hypothetical protein
VKACKDARCEVRVGPDTPITVNIRKQSLALHVGSIEQGKLTLAIASPGQMNFKVDGDNEAHSSFSDGVATSTGHTGLRVTINGLVAEVVGVVDSAAVLRLTPA